MSFPFFPMRLRDEKASQGTALVVLWFRLHAFTPGRSGETAGEGD